MHPSIHELSHETDAVIEAILVVVTVDDVVTVDVVVTVDDVVTMNVLVTADGVVIVIVAE